MVDASTFLFIITGAFMFWATKGFKGKLDDEMVSIGDRFSARGMSRYFLGLGFWVTVLILVFTVAVNLSQPQETKMYKVKTNEKGEIIELEEVK